jgi:hypothetical protein
VSARRCNAEQSAHSRCDRLRVGVDEASDDNDDELPDGVSELRDTVTIGVTVMRSCTGVKSNERVVASAFAVSRHSSTGCCDCCSDGA